MDSLHQCAIDEAAGADVAARVIALLQADKDPHRLNEAGETAFNAAAANSPVTGRLMTLHWLESALAGKGTKGLNERSGNHGSTLAQYMAKWLTDDEIDARFAEGVAQGLKTDVPNDAGWTPLMAAAAMGRLKAVEVLVPHYSKAGLCAQAVEEYRTAYNGHPVVYETGLNAVEIAQARLFQDEGLTEEQGEMFWQCMDMIAAAIKST